MLIKEQGKGQDVDQDGLPRSTGAQVNWVCWFLKSQQLLRNRAEGAHQKTVVWNLGNKKEDKYIAEKGECPRYFAMEDGQRKN